MCNISGSYSQRCVHCVKDLPENHCPNVFLKNHSFQGTTKRASMQDFRFPHFSFPVVSFALFFMTSPLICKTLSKSYLEFDVEQGLNMSSKKSALAGKRNKLYICLIHVSGLRIATLSTAQVIVQRHAMLCYVFFSHLFFIFIILVAFMPG